MNKLINKPMDVKMIEEIPIKDRRNDQHLVLMRYYGGIREYFLSMDKFKDVKTE